MPNVVLLEHQTRFKNN